MISKQVLGMNMQRNTQNALYHGTIWKTDNILLRDITSYDFHTIDRYASNPHVTEYLPWGPNTPQETQAFIDYAIKKAQDNPRYIWELAVCHMQTGELIGGCALRRMSPYSSIAEIGFIINPAHQGSGYVQKRPQGFLRLDIASLLFISYMLRATQKIQLQCAY